MGEVTDFGQPTTAIYQNNKFSKYSLNVYLSAHREVWISFLIKICLCEIARDHFQKTAMDESLNISNYMVCIPNSYSYNCIPVPKTWDFTWCGGAKVAKARPMEFPTRFPLLEMPQNLQKRSLGNMDS